MLTWLIPSPVGLGYFYGSNRANMYVIILLLAASLSVALLFLGAFLWSVKDRQYEDDYSPPRRILFDDVPTVNDHESVNRFDDTQASHESIHLTSK